MTATLLVSPMVGSSSITDAEETAVSLQELMKNVVENFEKINTIMIDMPSLDKELSNTTFDRTNMHEGWIDHARILSNEEFIKILRQKP